MSFNKIYSEKLFTEKKLIKFCLDIPIRVYKELKFDYRTVTEKKDGYKLASLFTSDSDDNRIRTQRWLNNEGMTTIRFLLNSNYLTIKNRHLISELLFTKKLDHNIFIDTLEAAKKLGKTVNFNWSVKRFTNEHDTWTGFITNYLLELDNRVITPAKIFLDFEKFSGYTTFKTTKELSLEGVKQKHCVGGYSGAIERGRSGIYNIKGYTLELKIDPKNKAKLFINQFLGYKNTKPSVDIMTETETKLHQFNQENIQNYDAELISDDIAF